MTQDIDILFQGSASAVISDDEVRRYALRRCWDRELPAVFFLMLNPSTADAAQDDPTIRKCIGFAKSWGYGSLLVGNLWPYRSFDPSRLMSHFDCGEIDEDNEWWICAMHASAHATIAAWGVADIFKYEQGSPAARTLLNTYCLKRTKNGSPQHPLYIPGETTPIEFLNCAHPWNRPSPPSLSLFPEAAQ